MNGIKSSTKKVTCGVPQGFVLGHLLFIIYINDLSSASELLYPILFADDTSVFIEGDNLEETVRTLITELDKITTWLSANKLTINLVKSHYMIFHRSRIKNINCDIRLGAMTLKQVNFTKFLGIIIDDKLTFTNHIAYIKNKISKGMGIILRARKFLNKSVLVNLYNTFVFPYLTCCIEVWGTSCASRLYPLCKLQNKIVRIITFSSYYTSSTPLYKQLCILPIEKLVIHE